jgi:hypothetical protein
MDAPLDNPTPLTPGAVDDRDWQAQYENLRQQLLAVLVILIVISGTLNIFFFRLWNFTRTELHTSRALAIQADNEYNANTNAMTKIVEGLTAYGRAHPDFMPVLNKYGISNSPALKP